MSRKRSEKAGKRQTARQKTEHLRTINGKFSANAGGFGFVTPDDHSCKDVFIPPKHVNGALHGDKVKVEIINENRDERGPVGRIMEIEERERRFVTGSIISERMLKPLDSHFIADIKLSGSLKGAKRGDWVKVRLLDNGSKHTEALRGSVEEVYGKAGEIDSDLHAVASEFQLCPPYTEADNEAAEKIKPLEIERRDLTKLFCVTIDPHDAKDFDDAISIGKGEKKGELKLGVHISDVAAWIRAGSKFDKEAYKRCFSSYLPGMFLPMLPKKLTAQISLKANRDSNAHSVIFTIRESDGKILKSERFHSVIHVKYRMNFDQVEAFMADPESAPKEWKTNVKRNLAKLIDITRKMRRRRRETEEYLAIETSEIRVLCDEATKQITGIERKVQREADQLVEECMLAANSAVANELIERKIPGIFRVHPEPDPEKMDEFSFFMEKSFHIRTGDLMNRTNCCRFLEKLPDDHRKPVIVSNFLRSLPRASYLEENALHYGLGKYRYAHFTSPIRRYPDLVVHRQLWAADTNKTLKSKKTMAAIASECSIREERNDEAYFEANDRLKIHYLRMQGIDGEQVATYEGVISKVSSNGLLCDITDLGIYGFVPSKYLSMELNYNRKSRKLKASRGHTEYKIGNFIYLALDSLDMVHGRAVFRPVV